MLAEGAQALEVLPPSEYDREHLPGARNIPLPKLDAESAATLDRQRPVIVYCYDAQCDLSARGAAVLGQLGFGEVSDYTGSKMAWMARGLPVEGSVLDEDRAGALADPTVPTCGPDDMCRRVFDGAFTGGAEVVVVTDDERVVLGVLTRAAAETDAPARDAMKRGPATVRPSMDRFELAESMDRNRQSHVLVTTLDGRLVGLVTRDALRVP